MKNVFEQSAFRMKRYGNNGGTILSHEWIFGIRTRKKYMHI